MSKSKPKLPLCNMYNTKGKILKPYFLSICLFSLSDTIQLRSSSEKFRVTDFFFIFCFSISGVFVKDCSIHFRVLYDIRFSETNKYSPCSVVYSIAFVRESCV